MQNIRRVKSWLVILLIAIFIGAAYSACGPTEKNPQQAQNKAEALYKKGQDLWSQGKYDEALNTWEKSAQADPNYFDVQFQLGSSYKMIGDAANGKNDTATAQAAYNKASQYYLKAIAINDKEPYAHNNLGNIYVLMSKVDEGIDQYQKAIALKPYDPMFHFNIATAYERKSMTKQAVEHYEEAIRIDVNYFDAYYNLALLYEKTGDKQNAIRYYQEYVNRENRPSEAKWVDKARQKIQQLRGGVY